LVLIILALPKSIKIYYYPILINFDKYFFIAMYPKKMNG
jgi:hypothetical protein